jgi:hypothetical protein
MHSTSPATSTETPSGWASRFVIAQGVCAEHLSSRHLPYCGRYGKSIHHTWGDVFNFPCWEVRSEPPTYGHFRRTSGYYVTTDRGNTLEQPAWYKDCFL